MKKTSFSLGGMYPTHTYNPAQILFQTGTDLGGAVPWTNPQRACIATVGQNATCVLGSVLVLSNTIQVVNMQTAGDVPSGATVRGVRVTVQCQASVAGLFLASPELLCGGQAFSTAKQYPSFGVEVPLTVTAYTIGYPHDMWGKTTALLNPTNINDPTFGFKMRAMATLTPGTLTVPLISVRVFYDP